MMNYKQTPIYLCAFTKEWKKKVKPTRSIASHNYGKINNQIILWPKKIDSATINPENFSELKKHYNIKELLFIDRIIEVIWSELIGLIAPVAHYVGIKVFAIGGNNFDDMNELF